MGEGSQSAPAIAALFGPVVLCQTIDLGPDMLYMMSPSVKFLSTETFMNAADIDETASLLPAYEARQHAPQKPTPLPKAQLAILCAVRLMDPLTFTQMSIFRSQ